MGGVILPERTYINLSKAATKLARFGAAEWGEFHVAVDQISFRFDRVGGDRFRRIRLFGPDLYTCGLCPTGRGSC